MRNLLLFIFCLTMVLSTCSTQQENYVPVESSFPLQQSQVLPMKDPVQRIAASDSWMAIYTSGTLIAVDISTQQTLWQRGLELQADIDQSLEIVDNTVIAASAKQVFLIDKSGKMKELTLESPDDEIIKLVAVYPDYVYVIRFPDWRLEAYSVSQNKKLWAVRVGRGGANVFCDQSMNLAYITTRDSSFLALNNTTGELVWKQDRSSLYSAFEEDVIYAVENGKGNNQFRLSAFDVRTQHELWANEISSGSHVYNITIIDELLVVSGNGGLVAIDKSNGMIAWQSAKGEKFQTKPVKVDNVIYAKAMSLAVYAISPSTGDFIGFVSQEAADNVQPMYEILSGVYAIDDGILFNTRNAVLLYKTK